jgi:hypothetical protein
MTTGISGNLATYVENQKSKRDTRFGGTGTLFCVDEWGIGNHLADGNSPIKLGIAYEFEVHYHYSAFIKFNQVMIPRGTAITGAHISFTSMNAIDSGTCSVTICAEDTDNAGLYDVLAPEDINSVTKTSSTVTWSMSTWNANTAYDSPDISSIIQEIVNRQNWRCGNSIYIFMLNDEGTSASKRAFVTGAETPKLYISIGKSTPSSSIDIQSYGEGNSALTTFGSNEIFTDLPYIYLGRHVDGASYNSGIRFPVANIPKNATLTYASLKLYPYAGFGNANNTCNITLTGQLAGDSSVFTTYNDFYARNLTVAGAAISSMPDISPYPYLVYENGGVLTLMQEIVNHADWVSGNNISLLIFDNSSSVNAVRAFHAFGAYTLEVNYPKMPRLHVEWLV